MQNQVFTTLSPEELEKIIQEAVAKSLQELLPKMRNEKESSQQLLSRKEAAEYLKISLVTLHDWTNHNIIKSYKLGGRVYYDKIQLYELVKDVEG